MITLKNIYAAVDLSKSSKEVLVQAARLAKLDGGALHVLHVIDALVLQDLHEAVGDPLDRLRDETMEGARVAILGLLGESKLAPGAVDVQIAVGAPLAEILRRFAYGAGDLLVVARNGASDPERGPGPFAMRCARKAAGAVLIVAPGRRGPFRTIVAGVDFSDNSQRALGAALTLARQDKAAVTAIHAFAGPWHRLHYRTATREAEPQFRLQYRKALEGRLRQFAEAPGIEGARFETMVDDCSDAAQSLVNAAKSKQADLVVVGTQGRTGLPRLLMGSTAERVLQESPCSVLVVKPAGFTYDLE